MRRILILLSIVPLTTSCQKAPENGAAAIEYPHTATVDVVDDYHGTPVEDPYRWLEDDVRENERVASWVEAQNDVTFAYLATIPERDRIARRMTELWDYERFGIPVKAGGRYFYDYNDGLQNQDVILMQATLEDEPELLIDPNTWSDDGTVALASYFPSPDGRYIAYLVQDGGSDWRVARVYDVEARQTLADELEWLKFTGIAWSGDSSGFYYSRYPATDMADRFQSLNTDMTVYYHSIGDPQSGDEVVYARPDHPDWNFAT